MISWKEKYLKYKLKYKKTKNKQIAGMINYNNKEILTPIDAFRQRKKRLEYLSNIYKNHNDKDIINHRLNLEIIMSDDYYNKYVLSLYKYIFDNLTNYTYNGDYNIILSPVYSEKDKSKYFSKSIKNIPSINNLNLNKYTFKLKQSLLSDFSGNQYMSIKYFLIGSSIIDIYDKYLDQEYNYTNINENTIPRFGDHDFKFGDIEIIDNDTNEILSIEDFHKIYKKNIDEYVNIEDVIIQTTDLEVIEKFGIDKLIEFFDNDYSINIFDNESIITQNILNYVYDLITKFNIDNKEYIENINEELLNHNIRINRLKPYIITKDNKVNMFIDWSDLTTNFNSKDAVIENTFIPDNINFNNYSIINLFNEIHQSDIQIIVPNINFYLIETLNKVFYSYNEQNDKSKIIPLYLKLKYIINKFKQFEIDISKTLNYSYSSHFYRNKDNVKLLTNILGQKPNFSSSILRYYR